MSCGRCYSVEYSKRETENQVGLHKIECKLNEQCAQNSHVLLIVLEVFSRIIS